LLVQNIWALFALAHFSEKFSFAVTTSIIVEQPWGNQAETADFTGFSFDLFRGFLLIFQTEKRHFPN